MHFKELFDDSPVAFYTCDAHGKISYYNRSAAALWGREPVVGEESWCGSLKLCSPDGSPLPKEDSPMARAAKEERLQKRFEIKVELPDGSFRNLLVYPQLKHNEKNEITGSCFTLVDISDRHKDHIKQVTLSAIEQSSDDAIVSKDLDGKITSWNAGAERIFGYTEKEALGKQITMLIPQDRLNEETYIISNIKEGKKIDHIETIRLDKSGKEIPISVTVSPLKDASGKIIGASKVARDISDKLQVEEKQAMLSAIVESSDDAIVSKDLNGIIMSWNRGAEQIFGYKEEEVIGKSIKILFPKERLQEEDVIINRVINGKKIDHFETIRRHKSGKEIPVSITVSPIKDSHGRIIGASKVARDISAQVESQVAMEKYIKNLEILNSVGKSISEKLDVKGILQRVTDATTDLTGAAYGACFYKNTGEKEGGLRLFTTSEYQLPSGNSVKTSHSRVFESSFIPEEVVRVDDISDHHNKLKKGFPFGISTENSPIKSYLAVPIISKSGFVIGGLQFGHPAAGAFTEEHELMVMNIAAQAAVSLENSKLFEQVKSLSAKKDEFIALASHELKTPLTTIKGYLQVLSKLKQEGMPQHFLSKSLNQVDKLNTLVEDLLNMSRIEAGQLNFHLEVFDLKEMLHDLIDTFTYSSQTHKVVKDLGNSAAMIEGDKQRIEQAILNLLTNAIKYSPRADAIYVSLEVTENHVRLKVRDEGIGLTEDQKRQLFTRFYRAENTTGISGLGLGLYLTKQIIDRHQGKIEVTSEYGKGSEFCFTLPMKKLETQNRLYKSNSLR
ncbi:PAS domain S-box protein [Salinimicrobium catena]|uniref:PAS domain S-box protein n=1 Tax=Salinimicrobium catena TaxID=390640 RepID=UPI002FE4D00E